MKKLIIIILSILFVLIGIAAFGLYVRDQNIKKAEIRRRNEINQTATELARDLKNFKLLDNHNITELEEGKLFKFGNSIDANIEYGFDIEHYHLIDEGLILIDSDNKINVISNILIDGEYCSFENDTFNCNIENTKDTGVNLVENIEYKVGDEVTLNNGSKWHVIKNSSKYSNYVTLLNDSVVDVKSESYTNYEFMDDYEDGIAFDKSNSEKYDIEKVGNIGYYIENIYKNSFSIPLYEARLLTYNEYLLLEDVVDSSNLNEDMLYDEVPHNWFYNHTLSNWWVLDADETDTYTYTVIWANGFREGGFMLVEPNTQYYLRPVIVLEKSNI